MIEDKLAPAQNSFGTTDVNDKGKRDSNKAKKWSKSGCRQHAGGGLVLFEAEAGRPWQAAEKAMFQISKIVKSLTEMHCFVLNA